MHLNLMTVKQAADYLLVKPNTIHTLMSKGFISRIKIGRSTRLDKAEIDDYIKRQQLN